MEQHNLPSQIGLSRQEIINLCQGTVTPEKLADIISKNNNKIFQNLQLQFSSINSFIEKFEKK